MEIYRYYYGAAAGKGIGVRAQSKALENLPLSSFLKELSSLHALESAEHKGEKLCYLLEKDGYSILGLSYLESPKESGYNRTAPCGLQYILPTVEMKAFGHYYGEIVRTVEFKKSESPEPEPMQRFPVDRNFPGSGCRQEVLAQIVDGLVKVTLSKDGILLIALPKDLKSEYETARAVIGEALDYLPVSLRKNVRFLTGLPVPEGETKCLTGYENAIRLNANVVFCPNQYIKELKVYRSFVGVDMANPTGEVGAFASFIIQSSNPEDDLSRINARFLKAPGKQPYEELNQAAENLAEEKAAEEAEAQRRKAQAQAYSKKRSGKKQDYEANFPDYRKNQRLSQSRTEKESQDIQNAESGNSKGKNRINRDSGYSTTQKPSHGQNDLGADSGRPSSGGRTYYSSSSNQTRQTTYESPAPRSKKEQEEESGGVFVKWVIPIGSILAVVLIICSLLYFFGVFDLIFKPNPPEAIPYVTQTPGSYDISVTSDDTVTYTDHQTEELPVFTPESDSFPERESGEETIPEQKTETEKYETEQTPEEIYFEMTPEPTGPSNTPEPAIPEVENISYSTLHNCYAITTNQKGLNLRSGRSTQTSYVENNIRNGSHVWAIRTEKNEQNEDWTEVYYNGKHGYIMSMYLEVLSPEESQKYDQSQKTPVPQNMYGQSY